MNQGAFEGVGDEVSKTIQAVEAEYEKFQSFLQNSPRLEQLKTEAKSRMSPSPRELLYQEASVQVFRYQPITSTQKNTPMLVVPSLVNKPCIMDLLENQSYIQGMLERGHPVYMLEWGIPTAGQKSLNLAHYLFTYLHRAVRRVCKDAGSTSLNLAGYCLGGTLALLYAAGRPERINRLVTMVTPVNFHDRGLLSWWADKGHFDVNKIVDSYGNIPADFFSASFPWLVPTAQVKKMKAIYQNHDKDAFLLDFFALDSWITENVDFPGEVYREIISQGYQDNGLATKGQWNFGEETIQLQDFEVPTLNMVAKFDHVSPPESCHLLERLLPANLVTSNIHPTGHLGFALGKDVVNQCTPVYWDEISTFLDQE